MTEKLKERCESCGHDGHPPGKCPGADGRPCGCGMRERLQRAREKRYWKRKNR